MNLSDDKNRGIYILFKQKSPLNGMEVKKIRREGTQLKITIPKHSGLKAGDYIIFSKLNSELVVSSTKKVSIQSEAGVEPTGKNETKNS